MSTRLDAVAGALASRTVVVCPHCSHEHADVSSRNDYREGAWRDECLACGKAIYIRREIVVVYETSAEDVFDVDPPPSVPPALPPSSEVGGTERERLDAIRKARRAWDNWTDEDRAVERAAINSLGRGPSSTGGPGRGT